MGSASEYRYSLHIVIDAVYHNVLLVSMYSKDLHFHKYKRDNYTMLKVLNIDFGEHRGRDMCAHKFRSRWFGSPFDGLVIVF